MEDEVKALVTIDRTNGGSSWARKAAAQGQRVIGLVCSYVPEEIVYAAGAYPWRVSGTADSNIMLASRYRAERSCGYCNHVLESLLASELDFLNGIILEDYDDDRRRLADVCQYLGKLDLIEEVHVPFKQSPLTCQRFANELTRIYDVLRGACCGNATSERLHFATRDCNIATRTCNKTRELLRRVYQLRKNEVPPLTGPEYLGLVFNARVMPKELFNTQLEKILPYLEQRRPPGLHKRPRVLVSSDFLDQPAYLDTIESAGCIVAMDDFDLGSRYAWISIDETPRDSIYAMAKAYLAQLPDARMPDWDRQMDQIISWVREFNIDGVIQLPQIWSRFREMRTHIFLRRLSEASIPVISIEREYSVMNLAQLKTRVEAFIEMLSSQVRT